MYKVEYSPQATKQLRKLDPSIARNIYSWIGKNLEGCTNPRLHGKGLTANRSSVNRYLRSSYNPLPRQ